MSIAGLAFPRLHVIVDSVTGAEAALDAGTERGPSRASLAVQVRLKSGTDRERLDTAGAIAELCAAAAASCIVNDRVDLALAVGATGVHVGADDLPVATIRRLAPPEFVIGGTARDPLTARRLVTEGATYLGVGPTFATASKNGLPLPLGPSGVAQVAAAVDVPVIAIAGITADRVTDVLAAGAWGVAVISAVADAPDPGAAVVDLLDALDRQEAEL
jgi:thiamine-phosphate pyrophosphorylase